MTRLDQILKFVRTKRGTTVILFDKNVYNAGIMSALCARLKHRKAFWLENERSFYLILGFYQTDLPGTIKMLSSGYLPTGYQKLRKVLKERDFLIGMLDFLSTDDVQYKIVDEDEDFVLVQRFENDFI